jgi:transglutaminase-like putative cysteine protease
MDSLTKSTLPHLILWLSTICIPLHALKAPPNHPASGVTKSSNAGSKPDQQFASPGPGLSGPARAARAFDSLLTAGKLSEAKALCTGQLLRMFDFIAMAQGKMAEAIDTAKSTDSTLEEKEEAGWAYLKISSQIVFKQPMMGLSEMSSIQAIHLFHSPRGWLLAEMEELDGTSTPVRLRTGKPEEAQAAVGEASPAPDSASTPKLFPVSEKAPATIGDIDRMQYRIRLKNGGSLSQYCTRGPEQRLIRTMADSSWILENTRPSLTRPILKGPAASIPRPESLKAYLASNKFLILEDTLLIKTAAQIVGAETDPVKVTGKIYAWVSENVSFKLGTVLFGNSQEVLRNLTGDCSEAAILTAALLRVRGIPSRLAFGFASLGRGVFIGHAWTEAYLERNLLPRDSAKASSVWGQWVGVDAALRQFPAGVERVKLLELQGEADMRVAATNLMIAVLSNLEIEILAAWKEGQSIPLRRFEGNAKEGMQFFEAILKGVGRNSN